MVDTLSGGPAENANAALTMLNDFIADGTEDFDSLKTSFQELVSGLDAEACGQLQNLLTAAFEGVAEDSPKVVQLNALDLIVNSRQAKLADDGLAIKNLPEPGVRLVFPNTDVALNVNQVMGAARVWAPETPEEHRADWDVIEGGRSDEEQK